jgi:glycosyltransferase involved in cell wall biosynthesis
MKDKSISLIIPAYNEENRIETIVLNYANHFSSQEIIVVCDGADNTYNIVRNLCAKYPKIKCLNFKEKLGKGGAIKKGFEIANGDIIGFVDADESVQPQDLERMLEVLSHTDGVIASRKLKESRILIKQPFKRRLASKMFNILVRAIFQLNFKDTQCGAKFFRKEAIKEVLPELKTSGFEFDVELLWRLKRLGFNVIEFPITWKHSQGSTFRLSNSWAMFISLLRIRLWK